MGGGEKEERTEGEKMGERGERGREGGKGTIRKQKKKMMPEDVGRKEERSEKAVNGWGQTGGEIK